MVALLLISIFIRPFISSLAFPYLNLAYSVILLGILLFWVILKGLPLKAVKSIKYSLILFIVALIISIIFSSDKITSLGHLYKYITFILIFLISISLSDKLKIQVIYTIILAGVIISILAVYQYFFGFQHTISYIAREKISSPFVLDYISQKRVFFPFVTPNTLAGYLILILPLVFSIEGAKKWVFFIPVAVALLFTKSIGAFLSLFLGVGLCIFLRKGLSWKKTIMLAIIAFCFIFIFILRSSTVKQHFQPAFSVIERLNYWKGTLRIIKTHPFVGVGPGNFNLPQSRYAHNSYLQIWAEMGVWGIISFLWLIYAVLKFNLQRLKTAVYKKEVLYLLTAATIFLIHNFLDFTFFLPEVSTIWWVILGMSVFSYQPGK